MWRRMSAREVMEVLNFKEFSQLCKLIDMGWGKQTEGGIQSVGYEVKVAARSGYVHFNVYQIERTKDKIKVAVDIGHGKIGVIDIVACDKAVTRILETGHDAA